MEVPRLGVESELQLPAYTTATRDPSHVCDLHHSSRQRRILNPLNEARDWTCILMGTSRIHFCCTTMGTPFLFFFFFFRDVCLACHSNTSLCGLHFIYFFCLFFFFFRVISVAYGSSQDRGWIGAVAASLHHSNAGSEPSLGPIPQITTTPDPQPMEQVHGLNLRPHGY